MHNERARVNQDQIREQMCGGSVDNERSFEIPRELDGLGSILSALEENISSLVQRLKPICSEKPTSDAENKKDGGSGTELGEQLRLLRTRVEQINRKVDHLSQDLEI